MTRHILFFIHGMGKHRPGWSDAAWKSLRDAYQLYDELHEFPFDQHFERHEIVFDNVFEWYRERWREDAAQLNELIGVSDAAPALIERVMSLAGSLGEDRFFTTHLLDVVMYRYLSLVAQPVRVQVAKQIAKKINQALNAEPQPWSVVSHSLGTSVAHDALHYLFAGGESEIAVLSREDFAPEVGLFVANVSRLLEQPHLRVYRSLVRPSWQRANGIFDFYLNARHIYDPFTRIKPFDPDFDWLDEDTRDLRFARYQELRISEVLHPDVHDLAHYLDNPGVHVPFFRALFRRSSMIKQASERRETEAHRRRALDARIDAAREHLTRINDEMRPGVEGVIETAERFRALTELWDVSP